jgi:hypothetical protein
VLVPVVYICPGQVFRLKDQEVFSIMFLRRSGEVERSCYYHLSIDNHNLIVGDGMGWVNEKNEQGSVLEGPVRKLTGFFWVGQSRTVREETHFPKPKKSFRHEKNGTEVVQITALLPKQKRGRSPYFLIR